MIEKMINELLLTLLGVRGTRVQYQRYGVIRFMPTFVWAVTRSVHMITDRVIHPETQNRFSIKDMVWRLGLGFRGRV